MQYSSDPYSPLNMARTMYHQDRAMLGRANAGQSTLTRAQAMALLNKSRAKLRQILTGRKPVPRDTPDFITTVAGIPCGVVVTVCTDDKDWRQHTFPGAGPGDCDPPEYGDFEFYLVDHKGYFAQWLEDKLTSDDYSRIESEARS